jgi:hypothetical protein
MTVFQEIREEREPEFTEMEELALDTEWGAVISRTNFAQNWA